MPPFPDNQVLSDLSPLNIKRLHRFSKLLFSYALPANKGFSKLLILTSSQVYNKARFIASKAYEYGYGFVRIEEIDDFLQFKRITLASKIENGKTLKFFPDFEQNIYTQAAEEGWSILNIATNGEYSFSDYITSLNDEDQDLIVEYHKEFLKRLSRIKLPLTQACSDNVCPHCLVALPSKYWEEQVPNIWDKFAESMYLDCEDFSEKFNESLEYIEAKAKKLNSLKACAILIKNNQTELKVKLSSTSIWCAGRVQAKNGTLFMPNFPSYEIYTSPIKNSAEGYFTSTAPINISSMGKSIFSPVRFTFNTLNVSSKVVYSCQSEKDKAILDDFMLKDKGLNFLGEIGIVDSKSPIYLKPGFQNTLFDENTGVHMALGSSILSCFPSFSSKTSDSDKKAQGFNICSLHQDIVIADSQTFVYLQQKDGKMIEILHSK